MSRRLVILAAVVGVLYLALNLGQAQAAPMPRTTVKQEGLVITITVPIEWGGLGGRTFRSRSTGERRTGQQMAERVGENAEALWNAGLAQWRYRGCYRLQLDVQSKAISPGDDFSPDSHKINFVDQLFVRRDTRAFVTTPDRPGKHTDVDVPYNQSLTGTWGRVTDLIAAHEIGHLLGLSDDYDTVRHEDGSVEFPPLPGREGTLMARGTRIDQDIVDRIGDQIAKTRDLPGCIYGSYELINEASIDRPDEIALAQGNALVEVFVLDEGDGTLKGEGTYTARFLYDTTFFHLDGSFCHMVETVYSDPEVQLFESIGTRQGDQVTINIPTETFTTQSSHEGGGECAGDLQVSVPAVIPPILGAVLTDGKAEEGQSISWAPTWNTGGAEWRLVLEERDVGP